jgi:hypothetical protein
VCDVERDRENATIIDNPKESFFFGVASSAGQSTTTSKKIENTTNHIIHHFLHFIIFPFFQRDHILIYPTTNLGQHFVILHTQKPGSFHAHIRLFYNSKMKFSLAVACLCLAGSSEGFVSQSPVRYGREDIHYSVCFMHRLGVVVVVDVILA